MELIFFNNFYYRDDAKISLRDVWNIQNYELNEIGMRTVSVFSERETFSVRHQKVAWKCQAIIEFVDLLGLPFPREGRWQHTNYLFFEGLSALRESVMCCLNGMPRSSLNALRAALELFLLHCWWQEKLFLKKTFESFYEWLSGAKGTPPFKSVVRDNFRNFGMPKGDITFDDVNILYKNLCSYAHAPVLHESIINIRGGNQTKVSPEVLEHWLELVEKTLNVVLEQLIFHKPQSLFPVDIIRKFGFSPPAGMFFDKYNFFALEAALDEAIIKRYQAQAKDLSMVEDVMRFFDAHDEKTDEELEKTWNEEYASDFETKDPIDLIMKWMLVKTRARAVFMAFSYSTIEDANLLRL